MILYSFSFSLSFLNLWILWIQVAFTNKITYIPERNTECKTRGKKRFTTEKNKKERENENTHTANTTETITATWAACDRKKKQAGNKSSRLQFYYKFKHSLRINAMKRFIAFVFFLSIKHLIFSEWEIFNLQ